MAGGESKGRLNKGEMRREQDGEERLQSCRMRQYALRVTRLDLLSLSRARKEASLYR